MCTYDRANRRARRPLVSATASSSCGWWTTSRDWAWREGKCDVRMAVICRRGAAVATNEGPRVMWRRAKGRRPSECGRREGRGKACSTCTYLSRLDGTHEGRRRRLSRGRSPKEERCGAEEQPGSPGAVEGSSGDRQRTGSEAKTWRRHDMRRNMSCAGERCPHQAGR
ncbi:hypothetical protein BV20DRAFT_326473 [Pilatotrama ljubarskyi]|nr:hypothetical protein BV20DRAFT_326473 [Pilatotrama ljubarskyi]